MATSFYTLLAFHKPKGKEFALDRNNRLLIIEVKKPKGKKKKEKK